MPLNLNHQFSPVPSQDLWAGGAGGSYLSRSFSKATYWKIKTGRANVRPMSFPCFSRRCDRHVPEFEGKNFPMKSPTCPKKKKKKANEHCEWREVRHTMQAFAAQGAREVNVTPCTR